MGRNKKGVGTFFLLQNIFSLKKYADAKQYHVIMKECVCVSFFMRVIRD